LTAAFSGVLFGVLVNGMHLGFLPYSGVDQPTELAPGIVINNIFISWSMFFIVAFLVNAMKDRLRQTSEKLQLAERELEIKKRLSLAGEFSAHLAHEIRNPLAAISGSVQVLKDGIDLENEQKELMENIVKQSERISHSIEQFLSLVSPNIKTFSEVKLASVVKETLLLLEDNGELNGNFHVDGNFKNSNLSYFGNINQFKQIFWNLIRNAIKAAPEGSTITIDILQDPREGIVLKIADMRKILDDEEKDDILESELSSGLPSGTGFGMAVVRRIIDDYNGKIRVNSRQDGGTEVVIVLPRSQIKSESRMSW
jgi:two-component system sensor histidine kinase PilS (NtrC family)